MGEISDLFQRDFSPVEAGTNRLAAVTVRHHSPLQWSVQPPITEGRTKPLLEPGAGFDGHSRFVQAGILVRNGTAVKKHEATTGASWLVHLQVG